jgi:YbbR domain-containing protein
MSLRDHSFAHTGLKVVSVALAVLLWMLVSSQRAFVERGLRVPLELQNLPDNLEMVEPPPESVDVRVRGTADALGRIASGDVVATVDLSGAQPGRRLFHLSTGRVKAPFAVAVTQVAPSSIAIRFEPAATRIVRIVASVEGEPAPGFIVGTISADPPTVEIVGPESVLRRVTEAITEPVWIGSARADVRASAIVGVADEGVRLKSAKTANVSVSIVPAPEERQIPAVPVRVRNLASGLRATITPPSVKVRVRGTKEAIAKIRETSIVAYVDLEGIGRGDYGLPIRLEPTANVGVDQLDPTIVSIHVE